MDNDASLSETSNYSYQKNKSFKDTITVLNILSDQSDTIPWVKFYPSDSMVFQYSYTVKRSQKSVVLEDYSWDLFFVVAPTDSFVISGPQPGKLLLTFNYNAENGFSPILETSISGWRTGTNSYYAAGRVIYSLASDTAFVATAGRDTVSFEGIFKGSQLY